MKKLSLLTFCLLFLSPLCSMESITLDALVKDMDDVSLTDMPLTKESAWLVHASKFFPKNGTMVAGSLPRVEPTSSSASLSVSLENYYLLASTNFTAWRNTIHWSLNSLAYPHVQKDQGNTYVVDRDTFPYIIIEPMSAFSGKTLCGYWQDVYHIGGHKLSSKAIILVSSLDVSYKKFIDKSFKGTIKVYDPAKITVRQAVENLLKEKKAPILYPADADHYHRNGVKQEIVINGKKFISMTLSKKLGLDNSIHVQTSCGKLQHLFSVITRWVRTAFLSKGLGKMIGGEHQEGVRNMLNYCHSQYLDTNTDSLLKELFGYLDGTKMHHRTQHEQELMDNYKMYVKIIIKYLYSPEKRYADARKKYKCTELEGFLKYSDLVRNTASKFARKIQ